MVAVGVCGLCGEIKEECQVAVGVLKAAANKTISCSERLALSVRG